MSLYGQGLGRLSRVLLLTLLATFSLGLHGLAHAQGQEPPAETTPDNETASRWWSALSQDQMVAALFGDTATSEQEAAARKMYADLDMETKSLVNDAASAIYRDGAFGSVGAWWTSLDCRLRRIATGDGNTEDETSSFCAHYPGSGQSPLLDDADQRRVDTVGMALLDRSEPGDFPADIDPAMRWWDTLDADQRVAALFGDADTSGHNAAATYADLDPETKRLVHVAGAEVFTFGGFRSVGDWWTILGCRLKRIATGDGNTDDPASPYCAHYPGSGVTPLLGDAELVHVDAVGMALFGFSEPGVFPADSAPARRWWDVLNPTQRVRALYGVTATPEETASARNAYADLDPETKRRVNGTAGDIYGAGDFDSVGAWWQSLECRLRRVATGEDNTDDASSPYCAHYPGSGHSPTLGDMQREHVNMVGEALLDRSDPGVYPPTRDRVGQATRVLLPAVTRAMQSSAVEAVSSRVNARLAGSGGNAARLNLAGAADLPRALAFHGKAVAGGADLARLLARSSFILPLNGSGNPNGLTLWGSGDYRDLSGAGDSTDWEGNVVSGHVGSDVMLRRDLLAGLSVSYSKSILDYTERIGLEPREGEYETDLATLNPYVGWMLRSGIRLWAMAGHGWGRVRVYHDDSNGHHSSDLTQWSAALGASGNLYSVAHGGNDSRTALDIKGEGSLARAEIHGSDDMDDLTSTVSRLRLALAGTHTRHLAAGAVLTPSLELGVLADGGAGQTGAGLDIGGGVKLTQTELGLTVEGRGRTLLAHGGDVEEWSVSGALRMDPGVSGQGWSVSVAPSWGLPRSGPENLWQRGLADVERPADPATRVAGELAYGFTAFGGHSLMTPYAGFLLSGHGAREYRAGTRMRVASSVDLALQGTRRRQPDASVEHGLTLRASVHW